MKSLIEKIVSTPGPSGYEKQIRDVIRAEVETYADEIRVDALGNLIALKGKKGENAQRISCKWHNRCRLQ